MFKDTDRQKSLFGASQMMSASGQRRLEASWAAGFQRHVYPLLLSVEGEFSDLYSATTGRPNWSVARMLGVLLLAEMHDLDDQSALDALVFDVRWQHALDVTVDGAYLSRRSLVEFRRRLVERDPEMMRVRRVFDRIGEEALGNLGVSTSEQRLDSTRITSNIRITGRVALFRRTLEHFGLQLKKTAPDKLEMLSAELLSWLRDGQDKWSEDEPKEQRRQTLKALAAWLYEVETCFRDDASVHESEPYQLVVRVLDEHCERPSKLGSSSGAEGGDDGPPSASTPETAAAPSTSTDGEAEVEVLASPRVKGASMQSPHDPDAGYGHKGPGYHVQIAETCSTAEADGSSGKPPSIITDFDVMPANVPDHGQASATIERLKALDRAPDKLFADAGYGSGETLAEAEAADVDLRAPMTRNFSPDAIGRESFEFEDDGRVRACPQGHQPIRHGKRSSSNADEPTLHAYFDGATCRACPLLGRCIARGPNNGKNGSFHLELLDRLRIRDEMFERQQDKAWQQEYRIRAGIEATNSELKRAHGLGRLRVRRLPRVRLAVAFKLTACNIKRWLRAAAAAPFLVLWLWIAACAQRHPIPRLTRSSAGSCA